jgi:hypothetical protein
MTNNKIDLPFGDAFSPAQLTTTDDDEPLVLILEMVRAHESAPHRFDQTVADRFFSDSPEPLTRAENVRFALKTDNGYGIVDDEFEFTELGETLYELRDNPSELYDAFAEHILLNLHGLEVIESIRDLEALGRQTTGRNIVDHLGDHYGIHLGETSNHWSQMRAWLAKADIINTGVHVYDIDDERLAEVTGISDSELIELDQLTAEQAAFLQTLALVDPDSSIPNNRVRRAAEEAFDITISQSNIGRRMLDPLADLGYIQWEHTEGAPNRLWTTDQFDAEVLEPVLEGVSQRVGLPKAALRRSFSEIDETLSSRSVDEREDVLETLTAKIGYLLDLDFQGWSSRSTGSTDVTALFTRTRTSYERWQITCLEPEQAIRSQHVTQAVGTADALQATTSLIVSLQGVSLDARRLAARLMQRSRMTILLVSVADLPELEETPSNLRDTVEREVDRVSRIHALEDEASMALDDTKTIELHLPSALDELFEEPSITPENSTLDDFSETDS